MTAISVENSEPFCEIVLVRKQFSLYLTSQKKENLSCETHLQVYIFFVRF